MLRAIALLETRLCVCTLCSYCNCFFAVGEINILLFFFFSKTALWIVELNTYHHHLTSWMKICCFLWTRIPRKPPSITAHWPVPNCTARWQGHVCEQPAQGCTRQRSGRDSITRPVDCQSGSLNHSVPPSHSIYHRSKRYSACAYVRNLCRERRKPKRLNTERHICCDLITKHIRITCWNFPASVMITESIIILVLSVCHYTVSVVFWSFRLSVNMTIYINLAMLQ